ncbi:stage II sporulation protein M [Tissierella praeacuta DSM 18095]|uniref:Stage II sporulation protein M n=1 Tax=Tissierella praeacuta DSM 18095 TaxID=1123404 RepID=A0A1M4SEA6_9FIRM|nr:stage II sporulation protein M [Tissierella praeacuta]SHE30505.1 stage II sporulation protein M [Tissierella praeacuta DSM 18095]SUP01336.1 stage II sporulation protein M [Tissierella praeacuta]
MISTKMRKLSKRHFQESFIVYFILIIFFIAGIIIGAIFVNKLDIRENFKLANRFSWIFQYIEGERYRAIDIFKLTLISNMKIVSIIWILGFIGFGLLVIPLIFCLKGLTIGFTVGFLVKKFGMQGFTFALLGLLPNYLIVIPSFLAIGAIGLSYSAYGVKGKGSRAYQRDMVDYSILTLLFFFIIIFGCFIEGFFTSYFLNLIIFNL